MLLGFVIGRKKIAFYFSIELHYIIEINKIQCSSPKKLHCA